MKEKKSNEVHLKDVTSETMKVVLEFMYSKKFKWSNATEMFKVLDFAKQYNILDLKSICLEFLETFADEENVLEIFIAADFRNLKNVQDKCLEIIVE